MTEQITPPIEELRNRALELNVAHDDATSPEDLAAAIEAAEQDLATVADGAEDTRTLGDLRTRAAELDIPGRSKLDRDGLIRAIADAEAAAPADRPSTPDEVGRPDLGDVAAEHAAAEAANTRHYGAAPTDTQED